mgnify:CR=1 FL=1
MLINDKKWLYFVLSNTGRYYAAYISNSSPHIFLLYLEQRAVSANLQPAIKEKETLNYWWMFLHGNALEMISTNPRVLLVRHSGIRHLLVFSPMWTCTNHIISTVYWACLHLWELLEPNESKCRAHTCSHRWEPISRQLYQIRSRQIMNEMESVKWPVPNFCRPYTWLWWLSVNSFVIVLCLINLTWW